MTPPLPWTRRDSLVALALLLLPLLFFQPLMGLVGGRQYLAEGDFIDQFMAFAGFAVRELADGRLPLWNPYAYGGAPFWADIQSAVAYPPNLALYLTAAAVWGRLPLLALELSVLLHLGLSAALTYGFARRHLGDRGGALLAALCFGLGGYLSGYPMLQLAILQGVTWLPLLLWAIERAADGDAAADGGQQSAMSGARRPRPDPWQALALALIILAGHPQTALHLGIIGLGFALWMGWGWARSLRPTATYLLSALLALLLSAPGWLPALDFMRRSTRASADYAMLSGGFPPAELLGALLPGLTHWSPLYLGLLPLVLALAAMGRWLRAEAGGDRPLAPAGDGMAAPVDALAPPAIWPILGLAALLLSLGRHAFAFDLFYLLAPGFDLFRGQERAAVAVSFSGAMLASSPSALRLSSCPVRPAHRR